MYTKLAFIIAHKKPDTVTNFELVIAILKFYDLG